MSEVTSFLTRSPRRALWARGTGEASGDTHRAGCGVNGVNGVNATSLKANLRRLDDGRGESQMSSAVPGEEAVEAVPVGDSTKGIFESTSELSSISELSDNSDPDSSMGSDFTLKECLALMPEFL